MGLEIGAQASVCGLGAWGLSLGFWVFGRRFELMRLELELGVRCSIGLSFRVWGLSLRFYVLGAFGSVYEFGTPPSEDYSRNLDLSENL